jgi:hypothetical protein
MKIPSVEEEFFHADGRTDMRKVIVNFRNFAKARKNALTRIIYVLKNEEVKGKA